MTATAKLINELYGAHRRLCEAIDAITRATEVINGTARQRLVEISRQLEAERDKVATAIVRLRWVERGAA